METNNLVFGEESKESKQFEYIKDQLKYLGFGESEGMHDSLERWILSDEKRLILNTSSERVQAGNEVNFSLNFSKSEKGGVFLNSYIGSLTTKDGELREHNFRVTRDYTLTAKEAINLLEGRSVKTKFENPKTGEVELVFIKLKLDDEKTDYGNYKYECYYKNYGVDTEKILNNSSLIVEKEEYRASIIKSLEKGNIVKIKAKVSGREIEARAVLNPQYKNISMYDKNMVRINTNKSVQYENVETSEKKSKVKEQSLSRSL